jgi:uncharacterized membrane protein
MEGLVDNFLHIFFVWVHVLGVALYVGPQFFLAVAWVPASRGITDLPTRVQAMRTVTRRFGILGGVGLLMIITAGTYLVFDWRDYYAVPEEVEFTSVRFGVVFIIKMTVLMVMLALVALHTFVVGPQLLDELEAQARGRGSEDDVRSKRKQSMALSVVGLVLALAIMIMGTMIGTPSWALQDA